MIKVGFRVCDECYFQPRSSYSSGVSVESTRVSDEGEFVGRKGVPKPPPLIETESQNSDNSSGIIHCNTFESQNKLNID